jgi:lipopolysaccharide/colanic/teichoic acid biosynthesis glycosyltransferase
LFFTLTATTALYALPPAFHPEFATALLRLLSPVLVLTALAVRLTSPGPILFRQRRVGRDGTLFDLYKFRSMRIDAPEGLQPERMSANGHGSPDTHGHSTSNGQAPLLDGHGSVNGHDSANGHRSANGHGSANGHNPAEAGLSSEEIAAFEFTLARDTAPGGVEGTDRRTPIGRFLRRTSLDELPQFLNVLRGEISGIGPRPERPEFVELFRHDVARYGDRHRVKSGITGWAQVHGLRGQTSLAERVEWDNYYIAHWSLALDLKILALTFGALLRNAE